MPYKSLAQERYFNANRDKLGAKVVDEFNAASRGMKLPARVKPSGGILGKPKRKRKLAFR